MNIGARLRAMGLAIGTLLLAACSAGDQPPVTTTPTPPPAIVANAGPNQSVFLGTFVTLNGGKSTNANQTGLTYSWTLTKPLGSNAALSDPTLVNPTLTVDVEGTYEATLIVTDAQNSGRKSAPATVIVSASKTNPPPVAKIIVVSPSNPLTGSPLLLNGSTSEDKNGDSLTFRWALTGKPAGSSASLRDATTVAPSFTPDINGDYVVSLTVHDGTNSSTPVSVTITVLPRPFPTAEAGSDQFVPTSAATTPITLDGRNSHTNPSTTPPNLRYEWTINSSTFPVTLSNANQAVATFHVPPQTAGTVIAQLKVSDTQHPNAQNFHLDTVKVTAGPLATITISKSGSTPSLLTCSAYSTPPCSQVPVRTLPIDTILQLDASTSAVQPLTYSWKVNQNTAPFSSSEKPTFTLGSAGSYTFTLTVTDQTGINNDLHTDTQSVTIAAKEGVTADFSWSPAIPNIGTRVTLTPNGNADPSFTYQWALAPPPGTGSTAALSSTTARTPDFTPDKPGDYTVTLKVTDTTTSSTDTKNHSIAPNTKPTANFSVSPNPPHVCGTVTLDGTLSSDSGGTVVSYQWTLTPPAGSSSVLTNSTASTTSFKADKQTTYSVKLIVMDTGGEASAPKESSFTPVPNPTGKAIYDTGTGASLTIYSQGCADCHVAGNYGGAGSASDLSLTTKDIKTYLTISHPGEQTTLSSVQLDALIPALRNFLDSTLPNCP